ncbi:MAG: diguanylate cyclase [Synergistaceae bacterium]|nr:diguanylate cyclase [Synergistaceae bacterium]
MSNEKDRGVILVVEDSITQAKRLERLLTGNGYSVITARDGKEGYQAAVEHGPSVVITDVMMPGMNGYEMCRRIKNTPSTKAIPVILLTSLSDPGDVIQGLQCGADNFLTKPYDGEHLVRRVEHVLKNLELRREGKTQVSEEVFFAGQYYKLNADRVQIIDLLLSTFEAAVVQSGKLEKLGGDYRNALEEVKRVQANLHTLMETTADAVVVVGEEDRVIYVNPAAELLLDAFASDLAGKPFPIPLEGGEEHREVVIDRPGKDKIVGDMRTGYCTWDGRQVKFATIRDVTEMARLRDLLKAESVTDYLTGLYNRRGFFSLAQNSLELAARMGFRATCLYFDLDGFKRVNDTLGHEEGDKVLKEAAQVLRETFRTSDIKGRLGGDEFAVLMLQDGKGESFDVASRLEREISRVNDTSGRDYRLAMSMGMSEWLPGASVPLEELVMEADRKMYENKAARKRAECGCASGG